MADEDEIDILGDFSFNSCFAQNNQGIPSCSNREDTVHPQWLLDSTANNWYDNKQTKVASFKDHAVPPRKLHGNNNLEKYRKINSTWSQTEREVLVREMAKYGRNVHKISQILTTKREEEIQALIEAEYGVNLDPPSLGIEKNEEQGEGPVVVQEEIVTADMTEVLNKVTTASPTIAVPRQPFRKKTLNKPQRSLLRPDVLKETELIAINPSEILYEDELVIGSTESIGNDLDLTDIVSKNIVQYQKAKVGKKIGNHRRKHTIEKKPKGALKSPLGRQRKDSSLSDDSVRSPKMQIVLGSGLAVSVSEGEEVIKIEKKKDSEPESDIEIDIDSDSELSTKRTAGKSDRAFCKLPTEEPIAVPLRKFEPMPRRQKKINLDGGGGYTIMHTEAGDLYEVGTEPKRERQPRKQPIHLIQCRVYNAETPAPYEVHLSVCALLLMDAHGHTSRAEVMGLMGGSLEQGPARARLSITLYRPAAAVAGTTHCDMDPVSQAQAAESVLAAGCGVVGWQHSHPQFPAAPSARDLRTQRSLQRALGPFLGLVLSQHWPPGRAASHYRCIRIEDISDQSEIPVGYQFSVKLTPDLRLDNLQTFLSELRELIATTKSEQSLDMVTDVCPQAGISYLDKYLSSASHHMRSAGYEDTDPIVTQLIQGVRDIFR